MVCGKPFFFRARFWAHTSSPTRVMTDRVLLARKRVVVCSQTRRLISTKSLCVQCIFACVTQNNTRETRNGAHTTTAQSYSASCEIVVCLLAPLSLASVLCCLAPILALAALAFSSIARVPHLTSTSHFSLCSQPLRVSKKNATKPLPTKVPKISLPHIAR